MPQLSIRAVGKLTETWQKDAIDKYLAGLRQFGGLDIVEAPEGHKGSSKPDEEKTRKIEVESLLKGIPPDALVVALDETGKQLSSPELADLLGEATDQGQPVTFLIGGSWGLDASVRTRANLVLSLGKITLPHALARIVLAEQVYRSKMIRSGRTYHK